VLENCKRRILKSIDLWHLFCQESVPVKGGRGHVSLLMKCKLCSRENSIGGYLLNCVTIVERTLLHNSVIEKTLLMGTNCITLLLVERILLVGIIA
jgi:hypothetical protein